MRISARLEGIVMRALQKSPGDRFQTAQEMALALERYAFASQGFNPVQLAVTMKGLFAGDFARWKRTVAASKELEGEPAEWVNTSGTYLRPQAIDLKTRGSTVALHPAYAPPPALISTQELSSDSRSSDSRSIASSGIGLPRASPAKPRTAFIAGVAALLVLGAAASFAVFLGLSPSTPTMTMVRSAIGGTKRVQVEALPRRALPPDPVPMDPRPHDSPPLPEPSDVPVAASASGSTVEQEGQSIAAATATRLPLALPAHVDVSVPPPTQRPAVRVKERPGKRKAIAKRVPAPAGARASAAKVTGSENCSLRVGTRPWAEIWIDGKNTYKHTPYLERIPCGNHTLTFKRPDLGLRKTYSIVVGPAGTFKETFSLQEE
ncbi:MAG: hypothetical protein H7X95_12605 [Deltaproteobacteria bacterium]|nr:hypothetical protein [Deltaproteobacteria bacterium]